MSKGIILGEKGRTIIKYPSSEGFAGWNTKTENEIREFFQGSESK